MKLDLGIDFDFGYGLNGKVFGGPFRQYEQGTRRLVGLKMAREIKHPHECAVDTEDFNVPMMADAQRGVQFILESFSQGKDVYAGCMGGIGRTGLILGCMVKAYNDWCLYLGDDAEFGLLGDPVDYVRKHFKSHAIETPEQMYFVRNFDSDPVVAFLSGLTQPVIQVVEVPVEKVVEKTVYLGPVAWMLHSLFGVK